MRTLFAAFLFCLTSTIANAESFILRLPVICTGVAELIETLRKEHQEIPIMLGQDSSNDTKYSLFLNSKTNTWTFIQFDNELACILGFGKNGKVILGEKV